MSVVTKEKFMFDEAFDAEGLVSEAPRTGDALAPIHTEQDLITACEQVREETQKRSFAEGRSAGIDEMRQTTEAQTEQSLSSIASALPRLAEMQHEVARKAQEEAVTLAVLIGRKLGGALLRSWPERETEEMVRESLAQLTTLSRNFEVVVRVPPELSDALRKSLNDMVTKTPALSAIKLVKDETLTNAACCVEWDDGGAVRETDAIEQEIDAAVERFLSQSGDLPDDQEVGDGRNSETNAGQLGDEEKVIRTTEDTVAADSTLAKAENINSEAEEATPEELENAMHIADSNELTATATNSADSKPTAENQQSVTGDSMANSDDDGSDAEGDDEKSADTVSD